MEDKHLISEIYNICCNADDILWEVYDKSDKKKFDELKAHHFIFPRTARDDIRVSEQEARLAFLEALRKTTFLFSVETPTTERYRFSSSGPGDKRSAQSDLSIYDTNGNRICDVEFKSKGISPDAKDSSQILKDIQKLLCESRHGLWFHLLKAVDNPTIPKLLEVLAEEIKKIVNKQDNLDTSSWLFVHICVLEQRFSLHRNLKKEELKEVINKSVDQLFKIELEVSSKRLVGFSNKGEWNLHKKDRVKNM